MLTQYTSRYLRNVSNPFEYKIIVRLRFETILENIENARKVIRFLPSLSDRIKINITNLMQVLQPLVKRDVILMLFRLYFYTSTP